MTRGKYRVLLLCEHPVQYNSSLWQKKAAHPKLDILVAYCSLRGAVPAVNPGFGVEVAWDVPLLEGYSWVLIPLRSSRSNGTGRPGLLSPDLVRLVSDGEFDAVYVGGYYYREAWTVMLTAWRRGIPLILSTDVHTIESRRADSKFTRALKRIVVSRIFRNAGAVVTGSSGASVYVQSLGVPRERIFLGGNTVDNDWWSARAAEVDRQAVRAHWNIPPTATVALFCAKLQPWKRPGDLLEAFAAARAPDSFLVFAGDGPRRAELEQRAEELAIADRVRFLGFVNQTGLPGVYASADLLVLPSDHEPFGLVVNEAMLCGCAALVSDRVGAKFDLIREGETGCVFPCGDVPALSALLANLLSDPPRLRRMGVAAKERMKSWTPERNIEAWVAAVEDAVERRGRASRHHS